MTEQTDWDRYYRNTAAYTSLTRKISERKLIGLIKRFVRAPTRICEIGGANSCFVEALCHDIEVSSYHVIDSNAYGLQLLKLKTARTSLTWELSDVLSETKSDDRYDLVYSVGLVEHFDPENTRRAIDQHFERCSPGGIVLITFPTPTLPYKVIRSLAERLGKWSFPDERPLSFREVRDACLARGEIVHESINWWIGLTQGYIVARRPG